MPLAQISSGDPDRKERVAEAIERSLLDALAAENAQAVNTSIVLEARSPQGDLVGGLTASTSYGWLLVKTLWVSENSRNTGLGRRLLASAETEARRHSCHHVWLETSSPTARAFYQRCGFQEFGRLENGPDQTPPDHCRWFLKKAL